MKLKDYTLAPLAGGQPDSAVIFLHGLGDSGSGGLLEIGRLWQPALPNTEFICPDAPFAFDGDPLETGGRQWFPLRDFSQAEIERGAHAAAPILNGYIDDVLAARQLKPGRLALVGFSQGTMMALYAALRRMTPVAGIVGYSGMLIRAKHLAAEKKSSPPVLLIHGRMDEVVPFAALIEAERGLKTAGIKLQVLVRDYLGHNIDEDGIAAGLEFLHDVLYPSPGA